MNERSFNIASVKPSRETYSAWAIDMDVILTTYEVDRYIYEDCMEKITEGDEGFKDKKGKRIRDTNTYYTKDITSEMIVGDSKAKRLIGMNIDNDLKLSLKYQDCTAYNKSEDVAVFINKMETIFDELKELGESIDEERKFDYLYKSIPKDITSSLNLLNFHDNYDEACKNLIKNIPKIKFYETIKENEEKTKAFSSETKKFNRNKLHKNNKNHRRKIKCHNCGGFGHISRECKKEGKIHGGVVYDKQGRRYYKDKKAKQQANNVIVEENELEHYINAYDNALNTDYNDDEETQSNLASTSEDVKNK
eukprot:jgi/Orpsp1_1/1182795/evm.model.c7180000082694.1